MVYSEGAQRVGGCGKRFEASARECARSSEDICFTKTIKKKIIKDDKKEKNNNYIVFELNNKKH